MILLGNQKMKKSKLRQIKRANNTTIVTKQVQPATDATPKKLYTCFIFTPVLVWQEKNVRSCHQWLQVTMGRMNWGPKKRPRRKKMHGMAWIGMVVFRMFFKENTKKNQKGRTKHIDFIFRFIGFPLSHLPSLPFSLLFPPAFPFPSSSLPSTLFPSLLFVSLPCLFYDFFPLLLLLFSFLPFLFLPFIFSCSFLPSPSALPRFPPQPLFSKPSLLLFFSELFFPVRLV